MPLNALSNKSVLNWDLKTNNEKTTLIEMGKSFHNLGPTTKKAQSP